MIEVRSLKKSIRNGTPHRGHPARHRPHRSQGQFVAMMGASGSGKSTSLAGLASPSEGELPLDGVDISHLEEDRLAEVRGIKIGFVFQLYQLILNR